jgi:hypothetical protein
MDRTTIAETIVPGSYLLNQGDISLEITGKVITPGVIVRLWEGDEHIRIDLSLEQVAALTILLEKAAAFSLTA